MFVLPKSPTDELWDGPRTGVEGAKEIFGADEVTLHRRGFRGALFLTMYPFQKAYDNLHFQYAVKDVLSAEHVFMDRPVPSILSNEKTKKVLDMGRHSLLSSLAWTGEKIEWVGGLQRMKVLLIRVPRYLGKNKNAYKPLSPLIQELRVIKSDREIELMKKSGYISAKAFIEVK